MRIMIDGNIDYIASNIMTEWSAITPSSSQVYANGSLRLHHTLTETVTTYEDNLARCQLYANE